MSQDVKEEWLVIYLSFLNWMKVIIPTVMYFSDNQSAGAAGHLVFGLDSTIIPSKDVKNTS